MASMLTTTFDDLVREAELDQIVEACAELGLDRQEARGVLAMHLRCPFILDLVHVHGGDARSFVRARVEIRQRIRASG